MKRSITLILLFASLGPGTVRALPASVENLTFQATISETLPGLDGLSPLPPDAGITVTIRDKTRDNAFQFPLKAYSVPAHFLIGNTLDLIARTTLMGSQPVPFYDLYQLDLANPSSSRRFPGLRQFSVAPDQQSILMVLDKGENAPWLALARLDQGPAEVTWLYAESPSVDLFQDSFTGPLAHLSLNEPIAWSPDSRLGVFLLSVQEDAKDAWKDYLARVEWGPQGWKVTAKALDLVKYGFHAGAALTDLKVLNDHTALFFSREDSTSTMELDLKDGP
ncbi:MAG TPA: hypothetical protein VHE12_13745 [bacterium]|nr:hypothetical protein [bacterium]